MSLGSMVRKWSESFTVKVPGTMNQYNQCTYTETSCFGRLINTVEEFIIDNGEKVLSKARFYSTTLLTIDTQIGDYKIKSVKTCKDQNNVVQFYKYWLV